MKLKRKAANDTFHDGGASSYVVFFWLVALAVQVCGVAQSPHFLSRAFLEFF